MKGDGPMALWGGRFEAGVAEVTQEFGASLPVDKHLYKQDIAGSKAHAKMLAAQGIISAEDEQAIAEGLTGIEQDIDAGNFTFDINDEDIHMSIESVLTAEIGDAGARLIGGYSHLLKNADVWFIVNPYRPWSGSTEHIDGTLSAILRAARLKLPRFLLNPNLGQETTAEEYLAGLEDGLAMLSPYVPVEGAAVPAALLARVAALAPLPLIPITTHISVPETELD